MGYVKNVTVNNEAGEPICIYVKFDDDTIGKILQNQTFGIIFDLG